jgi:anti-sigma factor RsiW
VNAVCTTSRTVAHVDKLRVGLAAVSVLQLWLEHVRLLQRRWRRVAARTKVMSSFGRAESAAAEEMAAQAQRGNAGGTRRAPAQGLLAELPVTVVASVEHTGCSSTRREGLGGVDCAEYN